MTNTKLLTKLKYIAPKLAGTLYGLPPYSHPDVPEGIVYAVNDEFQFKYPLRKDGKPDMRFAVNKMRRIFETHKP